MYILNEWMGLVWQKHNMVTWYQLLLWRSQWAQSHAGFLFCGFVILSFSFPKQNVLYLLNHNWYLHEDQGILFPDSNHHHQCSQKPCFSFLLQTGASPELPWALILREDGQRSALAAVDGGGSRTQALSEAIHPNGKTDVGSGGAGGGQTG